LLNALKLTRAAITRSARGDLAVNAMKNIFRARNFGEPAQRFTPPDESRQENNGVSAAEVATIDSLDAHFGRALAGLEIDFVSHARRLQWRDSETARLKYSAEPARKIPAKGTLAVVQDPAALRNRCLDRSHAH
jgi:hypothetical protein